jgi:hypothetical protein
MGLETCVGCGLETLEIEDHSRGAHELPYDEYKQLLVSRPATSNPAPFTVDFNAAPGTGNVVLTMVEPDNSDDKLSTGFYI